MDCFKLQRAKQRETEALHEIENLHVETKAPIHYQPLPLERQTLTSPSDSVI